MGDWRCWWGALSKHTDWWVVHGAWCVIMLNSTFIIRLSTRPGSSYSDSNWTVTQWWVHKVLRLSVWRWWWPHETEFRTKDDGWEYMVLNATINMFGLAQWHRHYSIASWIVCHRCNLSACYCIGPSGTEEEVRNSGDIIIFQQSPIYIILMDVDSVRVLCGLHAQPGTSNHNIIISAPVRSTG